MLNTTKLRIISYKIQLIIQLQASLINFEIIILFTFCENKQIIKKGVPQTAQISKLEWIFSKFPSQLEIGGEHLFWETARGVLFAYVCHLEKYRSV